jgi:hypothetical protein
MMTESLRASATAVSYPCPLGDPAGQLQRRDTAPAAEREPAAALGARPGWGQRRRSGDSDDGILTAYAARARAVSWP